MAEGGHRNRPVSWVRRGVRMTEGQEAAWQQHGHKYLIEPPRSLARESIAPGWALDITSIFEKSSPCAEKLLPCAKSLRLRAAQAPGLDSATPTAKAVSAQNDDGRGPHRLVVEIGTGRGENIVAAAAREPETNFLGVEVYGPGLARAILLAESAGTGTPLLHVNPEIANAVANANVPVVSRRTTPQPTEPMEPAEQTEPTVEAANQAETGLANLRLIQADAPELLEALPENSVDEFWVFFPDPWPKSKHQKRRLVDDDFIPLIARVLKPGGVIRLATDWQHYADQMQEVFAKASGIFEPLESPVEEGASPSRNQQNPQNQRFSGRVLTAFESKGIREGREITDLAYRRK